MSAPLTVHDLELESVELLPDRETLCCYHPPCWQDSHDVSRSFNQQSNGGVLNGNTVLSGNNISVLSSGDQSSSVVGGQTNLIG